MTTETTTIRRAAMRRRIGPHLATSDARQGEEITGPGIAPGHRQWVADTACGQVTSSTVTTRTRDRVQCPDCLTVMNQPSEA